MKIKKIAELAFHKGTTEPEAIAAFLALRRLGGLDELKDILSESKPEMVHVSSWKIYGPRSYITKACYYGCLLAEKTNGKCHVIETDLFKRKYTIILKYSRNYSSDKIEQEFERLLG